jgi:hypothetical protein
MGILDDYFKGSDTPATVVPTQSSGIINQYMGAPDTSERTPSGLKKIYVVAPPISGATPEQSDAINSADAAIPNSTSGPSGPSVTDVPVNAGQAVYDAAKAGINQMGQGAGQVLSNQPATGLGNVASGALSALTSPIAGVEQVAGDITGSKDIADRAGLVASALPVVAPLKAAKAAFPSNRAFKTLVESIGPENVGNVAREMKANPRLAPADLSPKVLQDTQHLFANDGPQINYLANTSADRMAFRKGAITDAYDTTGGVSVDLAQKIQDLAASSKKVGNEKIQPTLDKAKPVDVSDTLSTLDNILSPGILKIGDSVPLTDVKKQLVSIRNDLRTSKEYDAKDLHKFQSGLRETAQSLLKSSSGTDRAVGKALMDIRQNLVSDIDKSAPGYKDALSSYRDEMHIADAFKQGHDNIFISSKKIENDPSFTRKWFDGLTENEQKAAKEGARAAIYTEMGVAKNPALAGESIARSDFNKEKLEVLFGKEEAETLIKKLNDERSIANTHNKIVEGSQTQMRAASKSQFALPSKSDMVAGFIPPAVIEAGSAMAGGLPGLGTAAYTVARLAGYGKDKIATALAKEHNAQYAKLALPTQGPSRDELIRQLEAVANKPKRSLLRSANSLARLVGP